MDIVEDTTRCLRSPPQFPGAAPESAPAVFGEGAEPPRSPSLPHAASSTASECHAQALDRVSALCKQPSPTSVTSKLALPVPIKAVRQQNLVPVYNMPLSSPVQAQMMPVEWPPVIALDLAQSPHGSGSAHALDHLAAQTQQRQHLPGGYSWGGLWLDTTLDHDLGAIDDHVLPLVSNPLLREGSPVCFPPLSANMFAHAGQGLCHG